MNKPWNVGPRDKLPRGSFLYIKVGHRLFGGYDHVHEEKTTQETIESPGDRLWGWGNFSGRPDRNWRRVPYYRRKFGLPVPKYMDSKTIETTTRQPTGETNIRLVDDLKEVKRFRTWGQAQSACEQIEAMYAGFDIKVTIEEGNQ